MGYTDFPALKAFECYHFVDGLFFNFHRTSRFSINFAVPLQSPLLMFFVLLADYKSLDSGNIYQCESTALFLYGMHCLKLAQMCNHPNSSIPEE